MARGTMSEFRQLISSIREQMTANLSRSDILRPLGILAAGLLAGILTAAAFKAPDRVINILLLLFALSIVLYLFAYIFCLFNDRDALRSEKYSIQKMAIEHGLYGDSGTGLVEKPPEGAPLIEAKPKDYSK